MLFVSQRNIDRDQIKAAIKAQQDQQIDNASIYPFSFLGAMQLSLLQYQEIYTTHLPINILLTDFSVCILIFEQQALLAEGRFYSDLELTEKEIERMVMEASRAEYIAEDKFNKQLGRRDSSTSGAESSSGASKYITFYVMMAMLVSY